MRSGSGDGPANDAFAMRCVSILFVMITKAAETAAIYASHADLTVVAPDDIRRALCYEAQQFLRRDGLEADVAQVEQDLYGTDSDSESESEPESEPEPEEEWRASECACDTCAGLNETWTTWAAWEPTDEAEKFFKSRIDAYIRHETA
jgi:hypothetical protein